VRQDLGGQSHGDAFAAEGQQQGELHRQGHRLFVAAVVGELPLGRFVVEDHLEGELRETCFDIAGGGGAVAGEDIAPVALGVDEEVLLAQLHQRVADGGIAVGVVLHGVPDDVGHLVVAAVVELFHGMEDTPLHGLEAVHHVGHGPLHDDIRSIVEEPVAVHAREVGHLQQLGRAVAPAVAAGHRHTFSPGEELLLLMQFFLIFFFLFVHIFSSLPLCRLSCQTSTRSSSMRRLLMMNS